MKPKYKLRHLLLACSSLLAASFTHAATLTWDPGSGGTTDGAGAWLDTGKWWDGATNVDWTSGDAAVFGNTGAGGAVTLASPTAAQSITLNSFTGTYTLGTSGTALTINGGITKNAGSAVAKFVGPITLGGDQTWTNNSTGALTTGRNTNLIDNGGFQLTVDGTGTHSFGTINNAEVALAGSGALVKNGTGRLNIGGVNSGFTGTVTVNGGVMQVTNNSAPLGVGNLTLNGGVFSFYWGATYSRTLGTGDNQVQILGGESGFAGSGTTGPTINLGTSVQWGATDFNPSKFVLGDPGTGNAATTTFSSGIDLNGATRTIVTPKGSNAGGNRSTISGAITNSTGTGNLIKEGGGTLILTSASNTYNGTTTVSAGRLDLGGINLDGIGGGVGVRDITVAAGAVVRFAALSNAILNRLVETTDEIGVMTGTTANDLDFSSSTGANLPNAFLGNWAGNGAKMTYSGMLTPASDNYRLGAKGSSGLLGMTQVMSGTQGLIVGQTGATGLRINIVAENTFTGETVINAGSRLTLGNNLALQNSALNVGSAGGNFSLAAGTNGGKITGETAASSPTFGGLIGSRNLSSVFSTAAGNNETNLKADAITGFTLNVGTGNTFTYSGAIGGFGTGTSNINGGGTGGDSTLTKTGDGTQILEGVSTYTGATTISGGILQITNPYLDDASDVVIDSPAILNLQFDESGGDVTDTVDTLTIGGVQQPAGIYGATGSGATTINDDRFAGVGTLTVITGPGATTGFAAWQAANSTGGALDEDHDGDGVDNGTEFFLGGTTNTTGFTALPGVTNTGGTLSVTWTKAATYGGTYGTDFVVETSATLTNPWTEETLGGNVTITGDDVKYTFPAGTKNFARLKVTGP